MGNNTTSELVQFVYICNGGCGFASESKQDRCEHEQTCEKYLNLPRRSPNKMLDLISHILNKVDGHFLLATAKDSGDWIATLTSDGGEEFPTSGSNIAFGTGDYALQAIDMMLEEFSRKD